MISKTDPATLLALRMKKAAWPLAILAIAMFLSVVLMGFLAFVGDIYLSGRIALLLFALMGLIGTVWLIALIATGARRAARLIDEVEHHPEHIERIYAGHVRTIGYRSARMDAVPAPEAENMGDARNRWYVLVARRDPTSLQRFLGLNVESIPVARDEVLPLLAWLRAKAPSATGPPDRASRATQGNPVSR